MASADLVAQRGSGHPRRLRCSRADRGADGIFWTAPVGIFTPNALTFYDLGGNAAEWMWDGLDKEAGNRVVRGLPG